MFSVKCSHVCICVSARVLKIFCRFFLIWALFKSDTSFKANLYENLAGSKFSVTVVSIKFDQNKAINFYCVFTRFDLFFWGKKLGFEKYEYSCITFPSTIVLAKHFQSDKHFNVSTLFYIFLRATLPGSYTTQLAFRRSLMLPSTRVRWPKKTLNF